MNTISSIAGDLHHILSSASEDEMMRFFVAHHPSDLTPEGLAEAAIVLREYAIHCDLPHSPIDTCGTGGSGKNRINTSTLVAFLVAAAGGKVAKHGNKAASGRCGSFDLLEALGVRIDLRLEQERKIFDELGIVFLFARTHHPVLANFAAARKAYGKPTIFNLLGPLLNPASVQRQVIGVSGTFDASLIANTAQLLGISGFVVQGSDGLDEVTVTGPSSVIRIETGEKMLFDPRDYGMPVRSPSEIECHSLDESLRITREIAEGKGTAAQRDLIIVNAAFALLITEIVASIEEGIARAREVLASGAFAGLIHRYVFLSHQP